MLTASSTMRELQKKVDIIANNISNVNTIGYKKQEANFSDTLVYSIRNQIGNSADIGRMTPNGIRIGTGAKLNQTNLRTEQGSIQQTNRELDFMITGENGFFRVASEGKTYYTRDGSFQLQPVLNSNRVNLVTSSGESVLDRNNVPISFDGDYEKISVNAQGNLEVSFKDPAKQPVQFQLSIAEIHNPNLLEKVGGNKYQLQGEEVDLIANGTLTVDPQNSSFSIKQGALEMSNVNITDEMTELITTQRLLQSQSRAISYADDMLGLVNSMRG